MGEGASFSCSYLEENDETLPSYVVAYFHAFMVQLAYYEDYLNLYYWNKQNYELIKYELHWKTFYQVLHTYCFLDSIIKFIFLICYLHLLMLPHHYLFFFFLHYFLTIHLCHFNHFYSLQNLLNYFYLLFLHHDHYFFLNFHFKLDYTMVEYFLQNFAKHLPMYLIVIIIKFINLHYFKILYFLKYLIIAILNDKNVYAY